HGTQYSISICMRWCLLSVCGGDGRTASAECLQRLVEERLTFLVRTALLHIREVRLVRLVADRLRRVLRVESRRQTALRAVPLHRDLAVFTDRKAWAGHVPTRAVVRHNLARCGLTPLVFSHGTRAYARASNRIATCHGFPSFLPAVYAKRAISPSSTTISPQKIATPHVIRVRLRSPTAED